VRDQPAALGLVALPPLDVAEDQTLDGGADDPGRMPVLEGELKNMSGSIRPAESLGPGGVIRKPHSIPACGVKVARSSF
jgi:hypothetical protein